MWRLHLLFLGRIDECTLAGGLASSREHESRKLFLLRVPAARIVDFFHERVTGQ